MTDRLISRTTQKARKPHRCDQCNTTIAPGAVYQRERGVWEGSPYVTKVHPECQAACHALHKLHNLNWDEGVALWDLEPEDREWLVVEHPVVAGWLGIVAQQSCAGE